MTLNAFKKSTILVCALLATNLSLAKPLVQGIDKVHNCPKILVFSKETCPYCKMAKEILYDKGLKFQEVDLLKKPEMRVEMISKAKGMTTVPQIFIDGHHIGGFTQLIGEYNSGKLDGYRCPHS